MSAARTASLPAASAGAADVRHSADVARALERKPRLEVPCIILHVWIATASSFDLSADDEAVGDEAEARHGRRDVRAGETLAPMRAAKECVAAMFRSCVRREVPARSSRVPTDDVEVRLVCLMSKSRWMKVDDGTKVVDINPSEK